MRGAAAIPLSAGGVSLYNPGVGDDGRLVEAFRGGDKSAGEALVERYYGRVLGFFRNKAPSSCNDLAQRTFLGCFESLGRLRDPNNFRSFLFAVACNQLRKHYDARRREGERIDYRTVSSADLDPSPSRVAAAREEHKLLLLGLRRIPLDYQIVLELFFWEQMTAAEIAATLDIPVGTAKTRIRSGRQLLVKTLRGFQQAGATTGEEPDLDAWAAALRDRVRSGRLKR